MEIKFYTKSELGLLYFPTSVPTTACKHIMSWIKNCTPLYLKLCEQGYQTKQKYMTPRQVELIFNYLGEP